MDELVPVILFAMLFAVASWGVTNALWKEDTVHRGLAMYCPTDGQWAWNGECGK
jgi:hypothetical protein